MSEESKRFSDIYAELEKGKKEVKEAPKKSKPLPTMKNKMTFDRYFISLDRPMHHKAGMEAYLDNKIKGKKTKEAWDRLLKDY